MQEQEERTWATLVHLGGIMGSMIVSSVGSILGALIIWLIKRNDSKFVDEQGKEALNFQITICIVNAILGIIGAIRIGFWSFNSMFFNNRILDFSDLNSMVFNSGFYLIESLTLLLWVINIIFSIIGATRANKGIPYRYPVSLRFVK
jgi:uncharacterized Tic20 family protein